MQMYSAPNSDYCGDNVPFVIFYFIFLFLCGGIVCLASYFSAEVCSSGDKRILPGTNSTIVPPDQRLVSLSLKLFFIEIIQDYSIGNSEVVKMGYCGKAERLLQSQ